MGLASSLSDELVISTDNPITNISLIIKKIIISSNSIILLEDNLTVEEIIFKSYNSQSLEHLPPMLKNLHLDNCNYKKINNFPQYLESLKCSDEFYFRQTNIPSTLKKLVITQSGIIPQDNLLAESNDVPENLQELYFDYQDDFEIDNTVSFGINHFIKIFNNLPSTLKILKIPSFWNIPLINLPYKLEKIYIGSKYNQQLDFLPESIKLIEFVEQYKFNKSLDNLPNGLEHLNLQFQNKYSYTISNLPNSIKYLELGEYELEIGKLPSELIELSIATQVKFNYAKSESVISSNKKTKQIKYYELDKIGKFNIENQIIIPIPKNLRKITWWDGDFSVYTYKKSSNDNLWYDE